jgi:hypothetical protein|tara:strand:+ start:184 stop:723 length:540 start_codon:yes stop_codon:yes gene_type:complete
MKHVKVHTQQYVCFDDKTGQIFSIGPSIEDGYSFIEVTYSEIEPIKTLKEKMTDYVVVYNRKEKQFKLKKNIILQEQDFYQKISSFAPKQEYDVMLTIDKSAKKCYINTDEELLEIMKKTNVDLRKQITFSFTKKDDPHVLYNMKTFDIDSSKKQEFKIKGKFDIYTNSDMARCVYKEI